MKRAILLILISMLPLISYAQKDNDRYVVWQPDVKLTLDMLQSEPTDSAQFEELKGMGIGHVLSKGLWAVLDVPKTKKGWKTMCEKAYFCAAVDKSESYWIVRDSTELLFAQLLWDSCELSTRIARRNLSDYEKQLNDSISENNKSNKSTNGIIATFYMTALNDGKEFGRALANSIIHISTTRDMDKYQEYRQMVDEMLDELSEYATTPTEIERLMSGEPEKGYVLAKTINNDIKNRGELRY